MIATRRNFLRFTSASIAAGLATRSIADDRPAVTHPRATDGDDRFEPDWDQRMTVTVGHQNADLNGRDDKVLQAAVDYVAGKGGGSVKVLPGTYVLRAAVQLRSGIRLVGSGAESIITRIPSETIPLAADSDWYDQEVTLAEMGGMRVGDSVVLQATDPHTKGQTVIKRTVVARAGARLNNMSYSKFIHGLKKAGVEIDRKVLADLAISDPSGFSRIVEMAAQQA